jgi:hypothetical protein
MDFDSFWYFSSFQNLNEHNTINYKVSSHLTMHFFLLHIIEIIYPCKFEKNYQVNISQI